MDEMKAHGKGTVDRRTLIFSLLFTIDKREIRRVVDVTFGSASDPACSVALDPSGTLLVVDETEAPDDILRSGGPISAKATLEEWKLENGRYQIEASSERIESPPREVLR
jgi:hypothetical protein